jgi:hypothetical protein
MFESLTSLLKVHTEIVHDGDVIVQLLGRGKLGEPATFAAFWEVNPAASGE